MSGRVRGRRGPGGVGAALVAVATFALAVASCGGSEADAPGRSVTLTVHVPEGTPTLYLTGNLEALGPWDPAALAMEGEGTARTATLRVPSDHVLEYKVTLGSWMREGVGPSGTVLPNFVLAADRDAASVEIAGFKQDPEAYMADPEGSGVVGRLVYWPDVESAFLREARHVEIWLPPGYDDDPERRYRVVYMHDGQNLFDPRLASTGTDWGIDEAMMAGVERGAFEPALVVGVWNSSRRFAEYSPWHEAPQYARFLLEELKPRVDAEFRTLTGPEDTFAMGSSMGGLLSWYLVKEHPEAFGACGCVSSHFPLSEAVAAGFMGTEGTDTVPYLLQDLARGDSVPEGRRFFFDYGTVGLDSLYAPTHEALRRWLLEQGRVEDVDFRVREYPGADHDEASWRARVGDQLEWLLGGGAGPI